MAARRAAWVGRTDAARARSASASRAFMYLIAFGSAAGEWRRSISFVETAEKAIVAGLREGAGASEVVCVRDCVERDLSRNSTMD